MKPNNSKERYYGIWKFITISSILAWLLTFAGYNANQFDKEKLAQLQPCLDNTNTNIENMKALLTAVNLIIDRIDNNPKVVSDKQIPDKSVTDKYDDYGEQFDSVHEKFKLDDTLSKLLNSVYLKMRTIEVKSNRGFDHIAKFRKTTDEVNEAIALALKSSSASNEVLGTVKEGENKLLVGKIESKNKAFGSIIEICNRQNLNIKAKSPSNSELIDILNQKLNEIISLAQQYSSK
ncbi:MAG: hypothetical protein ABI844_07210 [Saprospiraceae bacterium]